MIVHGIFTGTDVAANCGATIVGSQPFLASSLLQTGGPLAGQISKVGKCLWGREIACQNWLAVKRYKIPNYNSHLAQAVQYLPG
jgi:hypothetical protein